MNSWNKMDSHTQENGEFIFGEIDLALAQKLCRAGSDHRKFMRQIFVSVDINAPLYWWKEFDTYKVGTTANSTSTMHKIHSKSFSPSDFSHDKLNPASMDQLQGTIDFLEKLREQYNAGKDKETWYQIIQLLPSSYNQLRTCSMAYENLIGMYNARKAHKLDEWRAYCTWIQSLPYAEKLICFDK